MTNLSQNNYVSINTFIRKRFRFYAEDDILGRRIVTTLRGYPIVLGVNGSPTLATDDMGALALFGHLLKKCRLTAVQFTGARDKNGEEIWEGAIVKNSDGVLGHVYFDEDVLGWRVLYQNGDWDDLYNVKGEVVCIGHILSNPELMETK